MAHEFELTDDEKRGLVAQRIKNMEAQKYDAATTVELLTRANLPDPKGELAAAKKTIYQADEAIRELLAIYAEWFPKATLDPEKPKVVALAKPAPPQLVEGELDKKPKARRVG